MTGLQVRVYRGGRYHVVDVEELTDIELAHFKDKIADPAQWVVDLAKWIRDNVHIVTGDSETVYGPDEKLIETDDPRFKGKLRLRRTGSKDPED